MKEAHNKLPMDIIMMFPSIDSFPINLSALHNKTKYVQQNIFCISYKLIVPIIATNRKIFFIYGNAKRTSQIEALIEGIRNLWYNPRVYRILILLRIRGTEWTFRL